ncbi:MAG: sodium-dependent transporter [Bdellovibrionota bacterium]
MRRGAWSTRYAFYLATVGSAFSLGNLWRFPYVVNSNGGGAFVLLYILCALALGLPIVVAELMLGKAYKQSVIVATEQMSDNSPIPWIRRSRIWSFVGTLANFSSIVLLSFYSVICGWVLFFLMKYIAKISTDTEISHTLFTTLMDNGWLQVALMSVHLLITTLVVSKGLKEGVEKLTAWIMPLFVCLMIFLVFKSLSLPGASDAMRFLFYPDFSSFSKDTLLKVLGHVFFTLSVGMGAMVVFGSYLKDDSYIPRSGFKVAILDIMVCLFAGFLIFPIIFTMDKIEDVGPALLFNSLPVLFEKIGLGKVFGLFFFLCLYLAVLGASIMLLETSVANLIDKRKFKRQKASWIMIGVAFVLGLPCALSSTVLAGVKVFNKDILRFYDSLLIDTMLPLVVLGMALAVGFGMSKKTKEEHFISENEMDSEKFFRNWHFLIRWFVPGVIILAIILSLIP